MPLPLPRYARTLHGGSIGILVDGALRCLGPTQRLRSRYGIGYEVDMNLAPPDPADVAARRDKLLRLGCANEEGCVAACRPSTFVDCPFIQPL